MTHRIHAIWIAILVAFGAALPGAAMCPANTPLCVDPNDSRYLRTSGGEPFLLSGVHVWDNLTDWGTSQNQQQSAPFSFNSYLNSLEALGQSFIRGWTWEHAKGIAWKDPANGDDLYIGDGPFVRACSGEGNALDGRPKFDLRFYDVSLPGNPITTDLHWNQSYFDRLAGRAVAAGNKGMVMSVMLFQGWSFQRPGSSFQEGNAWLGHPFHPSNNCDSGGEGVHGGENGLYAYALFPNLAQAQRVQDVQDAYIRKMVLTFASLDNIFWEVANEPLLKEAAKGSRSKGGSGVTPQQFFDWQKWVLGRVRHWEAVSGVGNKRHLVWVTGDSTKTTQDLIGAVPGADLYGAGGDVYRSNPPAAPDGPPVILDTDHLWGIGGTDDWVWQAFTRGYNLAYMDPFFLGRTLDESIPYFEEEYGDEVPIDATDAAGARKALGRVAHYASLLDLPETTPLTSGCTDSGNFCLFDESRDEYLIYHPDTQSNLVVHVTDGRYRAELWDVASGGMNQDGTVQEVDIATGNWVFDTQGRRKVLHLERLDRCSTPGALTFDLDALLGWGAQDDTALSTVEVLDDGCTLRLQGNTWKRLPYPYTITENTVLEVEFSSTSGGEIHGIGLRTPQTTAGSRGFILTGSEGTNWIRDYRSYPGGGVTALYVIPVGAYYQGEGLEVFFVNDHDNGATADSRFSNVKVYEAQREVYPVLADTFIDEEMNETNFGGASFLETRYSTGSRNQWILLRFAGLPAGGPVAAATLEVQVQTQDIAEMGIYSLVPYAWSEGSVTWDSWMGAYLLGQTGFTFLGSHEDLSAGTTRLLPLVGLESLVAAGGTLELGVATAETLDNRRLHSREGGQGARLLVYRQP